MCGIAGVVVLGTDRTEQIHPDERATVRAMCAAMRHRGPDDEGYYDDRNACLGMRRLSIIDIAHGKQPVLNENSDVVAVFNGEIYNFRDLQRDLTGRGHTLRSNSDSECLTHLYEDYGVNFVDHLRGMFGIAVWDTKRQQLILTRDRAGKKPLYYAASGSRLWFASELKCLMKVPGLPLELDEMAVHHYLTYQYVPHPWSIFKSVRKLPPAHRLVVQGRNSRLERYWQLKYAQAGALTRGSEDELAEELREKLLESTRIRLMSERPLGAFLSGGLDSSAVVAAMAKQSSGSVSTFSIGFDEEAYNELPYARRVAEQYSTDHHELVVKPDIEDVLPRIARMFDEPFADSSAVPSYYVAEMARREVVVALNGDGGDESFGGYHRYSQFLRYSAGRRVPQSVARLGVATGDFLVRHGSRWPSVARVGRGARRFAVSDPARRYGQMMSYFYPEEKFELYRPEFGSKLAGIDSYDLTKAAWASAAGADVTNHLLACDMEMYLPGDLLPKVDITTMSVSLEARSPLLDHHLMEWSAALPGDLKVRRGVTKYLFKKAVSPWLPDDLVTRTKMGFGIPRDEWIQGPLSTMVNDLLLSPDSRVAGYLRQETIQRMVDVHRAQASNGARLWALLMLELWHREVAET